MLDGEMDGPEGGFEQVSSPNPGCRNAGHDQ